jgi:hypothetical protein
MTVTEARLERINHFRRCNYHRTALMCRQNQRRLHAELLRDVAVYLQEAPTIRLMRTSFVTGHRVNVGGPLAACEAVQAPL